MRNRLMLSSVLDQDPARCAPVWLVLGNRGLPTTTVQPVDFLSVSSHGLFTLKRKKQCLLIPELPYSVKRTINCRFRTFLCSHIPREDSLSGQHNEHISVGEGWGRHNSASNNIRAAFLPVCRCSSLLKIHEKGEDDSYFTHDQRP